MVLRWFEDYSRTVPGNANQALKRLCCKVRLFGDVSA